MRRARSLYLVAGIFWLALTVVLLSACSSSTAPPAAKCLADSLFRNTVFWPTMSGTAECPLPADHPKCIAGTEQFCAGATR